jgi:hypothetical protein
MPKTRKNKKIMQKHTCFSRPHKKKECKRNDLPNAKINQLEMLKLVEKLMRNP